MSDIKIFHLSGDTVTELEGRSAGIEKSLQTLIERHLETFLGVRFLATEYSTGKTHGGRIDTLGIDENGCPVIIEYKRDRNENVINQGLFYLDWLMDHKAEFEKLVLDRCGKEMSEKVTWSAPRLICIAGDFSKYDEYAVQQIDRNISLIRYRYYSSDLLLFDLVNVTTAKAIPDADSKKGSSTAKTISNVYEQADESLKDLYETVKAYMFTLGDDVQLATMKFYFAFKRIKNFACVGLSPRSNSLYMSVKVNPDTVDLAREKDFIRDIRKIGHWGTGDLEITIKSIDDLERAKPYIERSYEAS